MTGAKVEKVDARGVIVGGKRIDSATVLWTAGVEPSPIIKTLSTSADRVGRIWRLRLHGFLSWVAWALIHIMFLPQLQNRLRVQTQWFWTYLTNQRGSRLIPEPYSPRQPDKEAPAQ